MSRRQTRLSASLTAGQFRPLPFLRSPDGRLRPFQPVTDGQPSAVCHRRCDGHKKRVRRRQHLHAGRQRVSVHVYFQPAGAAVKCARAEIQVHGEKAVGGRRAVADRAANRIAATDGILEFERHGISAIGVRAAIAELALVSEGAGLLRQGLTAIDDDRQRKHHK